MPEVTFFKPAGIPLRALEEVIVSVEEAEAIRLKDIKGMDQEQCAERMHISRPTFQRVLESARRKIAEALLNGKAIRIEGGNFEMVTRSFRCIQGHEWDVPFEKMLAKTPQLCPSCSTPEVMPLVPQAMGRHGVGQGGRRRGRRGSQELDVS